MMAGADSCFGLGPDCTLLSPRTRGTTCCFTSCWRGGRLSPSLSAPREGWLAEFGCTGPAYTTFQPSCSVDRIDRSIVFFYFLLLFLALGLFCLPLRLPSIISPRRKLSQCNPPEQQHGYNTMPRGLVGTPSWTGGCSKLT